MNRPPENENWHVNCSQKKVEVNELNKVGCEGCDCCGSNLFWDSGLCKPCASAGDRYLALVAVGVVISVSVVGVVILMLKYEMSIMTKHMAPLSVFTNYCKSTFSNFSFGRQWESDVKTTALYIDALIFFQPEGALFNPKCVDKSFPLTAMKIIFFSVVPGLIIAFVNLVRLIKLNNTSKVAAAMPDNMESTAKSSNNPLSSENGTKKLSSIISGSSKDSPKESVVEENLSKEEIFVAKCTNIGMYFLLLLFPFIVRSCFSFFDCVQSVGGERYILRSDENLYCYEDTWNSYLALVILQILFYLIGVPYFFYREMMRVRDRYPSEELYQAGPSIDSFYKSTGFLCRKYHPIAYYYEFVIMARNSSISVISILSNSSGGENQEIYLFLFAAVHFVFGVIHLLKQPLRTSNLNFLEAVLILGVQIGIYICEYVFSLNFVTLLPYLFLYLYRN